MDLGFGVVLALRAALVPEAVLVQTAVAELSDKLAPEVQPLADTAVVVADLQRLHLARSSCQRPARPARLSV